MSTKHLVRSECYTPLAKDVPTFSFSCRTLVQEAFDRRPEWTVSRTESTAEDAVVCSGGDDSLFYWGEYEGIDWEKVHSGELTASNTQLWLSPASSQLRASCHGHQDVQGTKCVACPNVS